jgi:uncharacterized membrane protein
MEALGPVLIVASIPLILRWVPQNRVYGFRVPATLRNESVWYDANALFGRHFFLLGSFMILLELVLPLPIRTQALTVTAITGLILVTTMDWRIANRWEIERRRPAAG